MNSTSRSASALAVAFSLVDLGVPVFAAGLDEMSEPIPPRNWQRVTPSHARVNSWKPGMALCAVCGVIYDVLDIDPRNGGDASFRRLRSDLGSHFPEVYWTVDTPSGGKHLWIGLMGIGSKTNWMPGLDIKGGCPDGSSRGFVFLPPTMRKPK